MSTINICNWGLRGAECVTKILANFDAETKYIYANGNVLGPEGAVALFDALAARLDRSTQTATSETRRRSSGPLPSTIRRCFHLSGNRIGDAGLLAALKYAQKAGEPLELMLENNAITVGPRYRAADERRKWVEKHTRSAGRREASASAVLTLQLENASETGLIEELNAAPLVKLDLSSNPLSPRSAIAFFRRLDMSPGFWKLTMNACSLDDACVPALAGYLSSRRSWGLEWIDLDRNPFFNEGVLALVDTVDNSNFGVGFCTLPMSVQADAFDSFDDASAQDQMELARRRLREATWRNTELRRRTQAAAMRSFGPARVLLHAEAAGRSDSPHAPRQGILKLPQELLLEVARHASGDAAALSTGQWLRIVAFASDRSTIGLLPNCRCGPSQDWMDAMRFSTWERDGGWNAIQSMSSP